MHRISPCSLAAFAALCLFGSLTPAHADIDMALNTSNFVAGQPSTLSVDGIITDGGDSFSILAGCIELRFDPAKVTISNLHTDSATTWTVMASNMDHAADGWLRVIVYNTCDYGQTEDGPMLLFTVTPVDSTVDVNDCDTLRMSAEDSDLCDTACYDYQPTDACAPMTPQGRTVMTSTTSNSGSLPTMNCPGSYQSLGLDTTSAARALRIAGGLAVADPGEGLWMDRNHDGKISIVDAVILLRHEIPIPSPDAWYTYQANEARTGRTFSAVSPVAREKWEVPLSLPNSPIGYLFTGVAAVPPTCDAGSPYPVLYANVCGQYYGSSSLYRIVDSPTASSASPPNVTTYEFSSNNQDLPSELRHDDGLYGTPLVIGRSIFVTCSVGVSNDAFFAIVRIDAVDTYDPETQSVNTALKYVWHRRFQPGLAPWAPSYSPQETVYSVLSNGVEYNARGEGGAIIVPVTIGYEYPANQANTANFLVALSFENGNDIWGVVAPDGKLAPAVSTLTSPPSDLGTPGGLPELQFTGFYHTGCSLDGGKAYMARDTNGVVESRWLVDGTIALDPFYPGNGIGDIRSGLSAFDGKMYMGFTGGEGGYMAAADATTGATTWAVFNGLSGHFPHYIESPPAIREETRTVVFNDIAGQIFGVGADKRNVFPLPEVRWGDPSLSRYDIATTPPGSGFLGFVSTPGASIIAGAPGASNPAYVFTGGEDGRVYVFNADTGLPPVPAPDNALRDANGNVKTMDSPLTNSMAAFRGRLYVLGSGVEVGNQYNFTLYCFGQP